MLYFLLGRCEVHPVLMASLVKHVMFESVVWGADAIEARRRDESRPFHECLLWDSGLGVEGTETTQPLRWVRFASFFGNSEKAVAAIALRNDVVPAIALTGQVPAITDALRSDVVAVALRSIEYQ